MLHLTSHPAPDPSLSAPTNSERADRAEHLGDQIAELAARLHAATYELLVLLREFDAVNGWNNGFLSCAHWLSWRTGIDLGAAREKVRVARSLANLPLVSDAMRLGELSYAKVRAITRIATPDNEARLVEAARAATAAQIERLVRGWRRVDRIEAAQQTERRHLHRELALWVDDDGMVVIRGRLTPEVGAVVQRALEAAADQLYRESADLPPATRVEDEVTSAQRRADALGRLAECALAGLDRGTAGDRYQVILHMEADLSETADRQVVDHTPPSSGEVAQDATDAVRQAALELNDGPLWLSAETSRRLACDAAVVVMTHGTDGSVLDVGRRRRTIPPALRRALIARDRQCRFPGCTARRCDVHHIDHWMDGGRTSLANGVLLCRRHHVSIHEGGFSIRRERDGTFTVFRPDGVPLEPVPRSPMWMLSEATPLGPTAQRLREAGITIDPQTCAPGNAGPMNVPWAIDVLRIPARDIDGSPLPRRTPRQPNLSAET